MAAGSVTGAGNMAGGTEGDTHPHSSSPHRSPPMLMGEGVELGGAALPVGLQQQLWGAWPLRAAQGGVLLVGPCTPPPSSAPQG